MSSLTLQSNFVIRSISGFQKLVRLPNLLIIVATQYLVRIFLVGPASEWKTFIFDYRFFLLSLATVFIAAAGYIINDYYDIKIDTINKPDRVVVGKLMKRRVAMASHTILSIMGIGIGLLLSKEIAVINFLAVFWLWFYSNRLKRKPFIGNLSIAVLTTLSVLVVAVFFRANNYLVYTFGVFAFFISLIREIIKDMEDLRGDMHFGCKTLPIVWGIRKTKVLIFLIFGFFMVTIMGLSFVISSATMKWYFLLMTIPSIFFVYKLYWADTKKNYHFLSSFCKWVMISGLVMMIFI
ncbi:geranylgeranylglycerol-phosphate geranylgeranyltransferase [Flexithrix dorotheae]|uniref:geranylgeranylglycerol-phosphate geranylgeranyltransferase n=1 Tax=Flexithrix dorotheae TaxID=70993 RepID=UPI000370C3BF|nr:geranylgeranylglycerol-phosphate geranylgeranyltransferase [Flexithrix dorotheae]